MEGGLGASDHRRAVPEPMAMRGGTGLVETPEDAVDTPVAPGCSSYGPTPPRHGAHTREKRTTPRIFFLKAEWLLDANYFIETQINYVDCRSQNEI